MAQKMEDSSTSIQVIFDCQYQISPKNKYGPNNAEILLINFFLFPVIFLLSNTQTYSFT